MLSRPDRPELVNPRPCAARRERAAPDIRPLSHQRCMGAAAAMQARGCPDPRPWVQVRRWDRGGAFTLCGQVIEVNHGQDGEWFKVQAAHGLGVLSAHARSVRLCSGDGRCTCEPAPAGADLAPAPVAMPAAVGRDLELA